MVAMLSRSLIYKVVLLPLFFSLLLVFPRSAEAEIQQWSRFNIPSKGLSGKWALAKGADIRYLTLASDSTLYCYATPDDTPFRFFKSLDGGESWSYSGRVEEEIVDIAVAPDQPQHVFYATTGAVYRSIDAGVNFLPLAAGPGGAGQNGVNITSVDAASIDGADRVVAATWDMGTGQFGGVYLWDEGQPESWTDLALKKKDVYCVRFSPDYASSRQIVCVCSNEIDTLVTSMPEAGGWGTQAGMAILEGLVPFSAEIVFPANYSADISQGRYVQFIGLKSGGQGDVYRLNGQPAPSFSDMVDLNAGSAEGLDSLDISSLAVSGGTAGAALLAGSAGSNAVCLSEDGGNTWNLSQKSPSGGAETCVVLSLDYSSSGIAYASTCGMESAFSVSRDRGLTWDQTGLIDSQIFSVLDLAVAPESSPGGTVYLLSSGPEFGLWRSRNTGLTWERVFSSALPGVDKLDHVLLSRSFSENNTLFLSGVNEGRPVIWRSSDGGSTWTFQESVDPSNGAPVNIDAWTIASGDVIFAAGFSGSVCTVFKTGAGGNLPYTDRGLAGDCLASCLALSPDFEQDRTMLMGNMEGGIYCSTDGGRVFEAWPYDATTTPLGGQVSLAFDTGYALNGTIYAVDRQKGHGLFRYISGGSGWESIDTGLPQGAIINQVCVSARGALYGVYAGTEAGENNRTGIMRSLDPGAASPFFDLVWTGMEEGVALDKLWIQDNTVWSIANGVGVWVYTDLLTFPVVLSFPPEGATGLDKNEIQISWQSQEGASGYHWQIDTDNQFAMIENNHEGDTDSLVYNLPSLEAKTVYYWRVRASLPVAGAWSETRSFDTIPSLAVPKLSAPGSTSRCSVQPVFKWSASEGATHYDLLVARDEDFQDIVVDRSGENSCSNNSWKCNKGLKYNSSYYWKVRALDENRSSDWSNPGVFTTEKSSNSSSSSGGGSASVLPPPTVTTPPPTPTATPVPAPTQTTAPTTSVSPPPAPSARVFTPTTIPPASPAAPTIAAVPSTTSTKAPEIPVQVSPPATTAAGSPQSAETSPANSAGSGGNSSIRLVIVFGVVLIILLVGLGFMVAYLLRKFKKY